MPEDTDDKDSRIAALEAELAEAKAELSRRTTERDYHLHVADILANKISVSEWPKRPVAFRVHRSHPDTDFELFTDEEGAQAAASDRGVDYDGLYLVGDRDALQSCLSTNLDAVHKLIIQASIASCTCNTKSPNYVYHTSNCRYVLLQNALESIEVMQNRGNEG